MKQLCPCQSNKLLAVCCQPFLDGQQAAKTPVKLMRSRYTAYALGGYGHYLLESWLPAAATGLTAMDLSIREVEWQGLTILSKHQTGDTGVVEFVARFLNPNGQVVEHHEKSLFRRIDRRWFYAGVIDA